MHGTRWELPSLVLKEEGADTCKFVATSLQVGNSTGKEFPFTDKVYNMTAHIIYVIKTKLCIQHVCYIHTHIHLYISHKKCSQ